MGGTFLLIPPAKRQVLDRKKGYSFIKDTLQNLEKSKLKYNNIIENRTNGTYS